MKKETSKIELNGEGFLSCCSQVQEICKPLFTHFPITIFDYSRIYPDGSRLMLCNHTGYVKNFIDSQWQQGVYIPDLINSKINYLLANHWVENLHHPAKDMLRQRLNEEKILFSINKEFIFIKNSKFYCECFHFYNCDNTYDIENILFNNIDLLAHFTGYFVNAAHDLIAKVSAVRVIKPWRNRNISKLCDFVDSPNVDRKKFINSTTFKKLFLNIENSLIYLTKKEIECVTYMVLGKTSREISQLLHISLRTVETHFESIRNKTGCNTRSELIGFLYNRDDFVNALRLKLNHVR
jgi:DNA-binding CsgD family transcriptional regulator